MRERLKKTGATLVRPEYLQKRIPFHLPGALRSNGKFVRVRDEGDKITFSYKQLIDRTLEGTKEICVEVNNFEKTCDLLMAVGFDIKSYQETKRERWDFDGVEVTIDTWPWIQTFVEIEGESEEKLKQTAQKLDLDWNKALFGSVENAYQDIYDVTEEEIDGWENITFVPVPDWLEIKRK